jgi:SAM-dependent methyltransferase
MRDTTFYNRESVQYSEKRYPPVAESYLQYFYLRRFDIVKDYLAQAIDTPVRLLEIGCADGIVIRKLSGDLPGKFREIVGVDIAKDMIEEATRKNTSPQIRFCLRDELPVDEQFDVVVEVGVVNYASVDEELDAAQAHMREGGRYILSIAGTNSLKNRLKGEDGFSDFRAYHIYEDMIKEDFIVERVMGCGIFVPYLWRVPRIARIVQPVVDALCNVLGARWLCHEQVYLLRKR